MPGRSKSTVDTRKATNRGGVKRTSIKNLLREDILAASAILDGFPDAVMAVDMDGTVRYVNVAFEKLLGYKAEELVGMSALDLPTYRGQENMEKGAVLFEQVLESGYAEPVDMDAVTRDGQEIPLSFTASLLRDASGNPASLVAVIRDVTERKRTELALRNSEEKLKTYLENSPDIICVVGKKGVITYINRATEEITGYSRDEMVGYSFTKLPLLAPESKTKPDEWKELNEAGGATRPQEFVIVKKDGGKVCVEVSTLTIGSADNGGNVEVVAIARDITERKHNEEERHKLSIELAEKNRELEQIVYVASHDLRSPLVNVQGFSKELNYSLEELVSITQDEAIPPEIRGELNRIIKSDIADSFQYIETSITKMDSLLAGLLRFSRLGRAALTFEELNINLLLVDIKKDFEYRLKEAGASLEIGELPSCVGDAVQLNQVFSNLVDNALKYRETRRPATIKITGCEEDTQAVYCVEDNGIGIAPEHQTKVFEIFQRLDPDFNTGEGLGLSIAKRIIGRHNGNIWVESEKDVGSKFFVSLPAVE